MRKHFLPRRLLMALTLFIKLLSMAQLRGDSRPSISDENLQPTKLYFVRHGETHRNKVGEKISGQEDGPAAQLNETGRKQADQLGKKLAELYSGKIAVIYTSPLGRSRETAQIIAGYFSNIDIVEDPRLMEFNHGKYDTMDFKLRNQICQMQYEAIEEETAKTGEILDRFFKWRLRLSDLIAYDSKMTEIPLEGIPETALEVLARVNLVLQEITHSYPGKIVLLVTHAGIIKTIGIEAESRQRADTKPIPMYFEATPGFTVLPGNCSITYFEKTPNTPLSFHGSEDLMRPGSKPPCSNQKF